MNNLKEKKVTAEFIKSLNYPDFVGFINQTNVLPGAFDTLSRWKIYGEINENSNILQIACTTGFQSRELSFSTGCKGTAFDLSEYAVESAKKNQEEYINESRIEYIIEDGYSFSSSEKYSHILLGAGLGFFQDPPKMLKKAITYLNDNGKILASPFYAIEKMPDEIIKKSQETFGIIPTSKGYKEILDIYHNSGLEVIYEERKDIYIETDKEIEHYVNSTTSRAVKNLKIKDNDVEKAIQARLWDIKKTTNMLREYQNYAVLVLRYREKDFPNRYVELF